MERQIELRIPSVAQPLASLNDLPKQEFQKGEIAGIRIFAAMPAMMVETAEAEMRELEEQSNGDDNER